MRYCRSRSSDRRQTYFLTAASDRSYGTAAPPHTSSSRAGAHWGVVVLDATSWWAQHVKWQWCNYITSTGRGPADSPASLSYAPVNMLDFSTSHLVSGEDRDMVIPCNGRHLGIRKPLARALGSIPVHRGKLQIDARFCKF